MAQAIDDQELAEDEADSPEEDDPVFKPSAVMEVV